MFSNKKTSIAGLFMILGVVAKVLTGGISNVTAEDAAVAMGGVGLVMAKDHNVTGGTVPNKN